MPGNSTDINEPQTLLLQLKNPLKMGSISMGIILRNNLLKINSRHTFFYIHALILLERGPESVKRANSEKQSKIKSKQHDS